MTQPIPSNGGQPLRLQVFLTQAAATAASLRARHAKPFVHQWIPNEVLNRILPLYNDEGAFGKLPAAQQQVIRRIVLENAATALRDWDVWLASFEVKLCQILDSISSELANLRPLTALLLLRSMIEHVALFEHTKLKGFAIPRNSSPDGPTAAGYLVDLSAVVAKGYLGTRMSWSERLFDGRSFRELSSRELEYQPRPELADLKSTSVSRL